MQKWCPEPLVVEPVGEAGFVPLDGIAPDVTRDHQGREVKFRAETGFKDKRTLMGQLSQQERSEVYELVEMDLVEGFNEQLEQAEEANRQARADAKAAREAEFRDWWKRFSAEFVETLGDVREKHLTLLAENAVNLALAIAEKVVRTQVELDRGVLTRNLQTIVTKLDAGLACTVAVHPDDVIFLEEQPELLKELNVAAVKGDKRIERGGCRVTSGDLEWDATLTTQIDTLADVVSTIMLTNRHEKESAGEDETELE